MEITISEIEQVTKVALAGRLDTAGVMGIQGRFADTIVPTGRHAVVDLSKVGFMASLGIRMLISTTRALSSRGGRIALYGASPAVMEIIETTSLHEIVPVAASEGEAIALVKG
jgi:anti-sigma B factor antagonist